MFPIMTTGGGQCFGFPNVCLTQFGPVQSPFPWPNIAMCSDGEGADHVTILNAAVMRKGDCQARNSKGAGPNAVKGVVAMTTNGAAEVVLGWVKVKVEGKEVGYLTAMIQINGGSPPYNLPGAGLNVQPSQGKAMVTVAIGVGSGGSPVEEARLECSPLLAQQIEELKRKGWKIEFSDEKNGGCRRWEKRIVIPRGVRSDPYMLNGVLAHEVGHALYPHPGVKYHPFMSFKTFQEKNLLEDQKDEGAAMLNAARVSAQMEHKCDQPILIWPFEQEQGYSNRACKEIAQTPGLSDMDKAAKLGEKLFSKPGTTYTTDYPQHWAKKWNWIIKSWPRMLGFFNRHG